MIKVALNGICGKMGKVLSELIASKEGMQVAYGIDPACGAVAADGTEGAAASSVINGIKVYSKPADVPQEAAADVMIDFSHFSAVPGIIDFCISRNMPVVICTTGLKDDVKAHMNKASKSVPVFYSANMSLGVSLLKYLARKAAAFLGDDFDVEIVEMHHNQKLDAPSGTALALADAINDETGGKYEYVFDRHSRLQKRDKKELGISAVRGGNIVGDHEIIFAGSSENVILSHHAASRNVFADGAVKAAAFIIGREPGMYDMEDMF